MNAIVFGGTGMVGQGVAAAEPLARLNPDMTFAFVSGAGTDTTEHGRAMIAAAKHGAPKRVLESADINKL